MARRIIRSATKPHNATWPSGFVGLYPPGLVSAFFFNEAGFSGIAGNENILIDSLQQQPASRVGGGTPPNWVLGQGGAALNATGGTKLDCTTFSAAIDPKTWAYWILPTANSTCIAAKNDANTVDQGWMISTCNTGSGVQLLVEGNVTRNLIVQTTNVPANWTSAWHHVVIAWNGLTNTGAVVNIYIDGLLVANTLTQTDTATGVYTSDAGEILRIFYSLGSGTDWFGSPFNGTLESLLMFNRTLSLTEAVDLYRASYRWYAVRRAYNVPAVVPSQGYQFYDSYPYRRKADLQQQAFQRNLVTDTSFIADLPSAPSIDYLFYDSFPYANVAALRRQAAFQRTALIDAFWQTVVPTGVPTFGYDFDDRTDYRAAPLRLAHFPRDQVAFLDFAPITVTVPSQGYLFYDSTDYRALAIRLQQAHFERSAILANFQATVTPSFAWNFYDSFDYKARQNRLAHFARDYVADAGIIFAATGPAAAPSIGYVFYDSFDYSKSKRLNLQFPRNYIDDTAALFTPVGFTVPSQDFIFYDSFDYNARARQAWQRAFRRDYIAEPPWSALITQPFVSPAGWYPIVTPLSIPVHQRTSDFVIGLPNDIRDGTVLPAWNFLQIGDSSQQPVRKAQQYRFYALFVEPYKPERTFLSQFFTATMAPWNASLSKAATRKFFATMQAWAASLSILSPRPPEILGFALNVCAESRILAAIKYTMATVCQDPRTVTVPLNTTPVCMTFVKDPQATTDYSIDWTAPLTAAGDTIATSSWTTDAGVAIAKSTYTGYVATAFVSGGTVGSSYSVTNTITTAGGLTLAQNFIVKIQLR